MNVQSVPSPAISADERSHEVDHPTSPVALFGADQPLKLDCGVDLSPFQIAYQTYGALNAERSNAILVCHALTGDQHVANVHPVTGCTLLTCWSPVSAWQTRMALERSAFSSP